MVYLLPLLVSQLIVHIHNPTIYDISKFCTLINPFQYSIPMLHFTILIPDSHTKMKTMPTKSCMG